MLTGKHLIAGNWVAGDATFKSEPAHGDIHEFAVGTPAHIDAAVKAAEEAFWSFGYSSRAERAALLNAIADEIEARGAEITAIGTSETGLPEARPRRRARPNHRAVEAVCQPYREGRLSRSPP
jgi:alpha-ketoglutaric semialdehyde dehydrogenase